MASSGVCVGDRPNETPAVNVFEVSSLYRFGNCYYAGGATPLAVGISTRMDAKSARVMLTYRSFDFTHWSKAKALSFAEAGTDHCPAGRRAADSHGRRIVESRQSHGLACTACGKMVRRSRPTGEGHLWGTHIDLGLIVSNDGIHFREPVPDFKIIARGQGRRMGRHGTAPKGHAFVNVGDKTMIWYSHWDNQRRPEVDGDRSSDAPSGRIRLSVTAPLENASAHFVTDLVKPTSTVSRLFVNVEGVADTTPLRVELLDATGATASRLLR